MNAFSTFGFVIVRSARNRIVAQLKRLKKPQYLIATLLGLGSWWLYFGRALWRVDAVADKPARPEVAGLVPLMVTFMCLLPVLATWVVGSKQTTLTFTEAEIQFFFPAPATRRALLHYKLLKSMLIGLVSAMFTTVVFGRLTGHPLFFLLAFWLGMNTFSFHALGVERIRRSLLEQGVTGWKTSLPGLLAFTTLAAAVVYSVAALRPFPSQRGPEVGPFLERITATLHAGPLAWLLWPVRVFVDTALARDVPSFLRALPFAAAVLGFHYLWLIAGDSPFEESAVQAAEHRAKALEALKSGGLPTPSSKRRAPPFVLRPTGAPEVALIWKGLIGSGRVVTSKSLVMVAGLSGTISALLYFLEGSRSALNGFGGVMLAFWALVTLLGGALSRGDLRRDLEYLDVLRGMPLTGRQVVIGEALSALVPLTAAQWLLLFPGVVVVQDVVSGAAEKLVLGVSLALLGSAFSLAGILVQNAAVVFFPALAGGSRSAVQGPEASGMGMMVMIGNLLTVAVGMLPAALAGALVYFAAVGLLGVWAGLLAAVAATGVVVFEAWLGAAVIGKAFEAFDPSSP